MTSQRPADASYYLLEIEEPDLRGRCLYCDQLLGHPYFTLDVSDKGRLQPHPHPLILWRSDAGSGPVGPGMVPWTGQEPAPDGYAVMTPILYDDGKQGFDFLLDDLARARLAACAAQAQGESEPVNA